MGRIRLFFFFLHQMKTFFFSSPLKNSAVVLTKRNIICVLDENTSKYAKPKHRAEVLSPHLISDALSDLGICLTVSLTDTQQEHHP